ncbi:MAG: 4-alpha-glucanotransferase [Clostridiales bacterium]|nr:4-alpha-glucanotransferase [Clostridiales bacterium]
MKSAGILMPVASLPSQHGIGDFGEESYHFIDIMHQAGWNIWQILPLNPLGFGNSPYQPYSSMAGDEIYISLNKLKEEGLLDQVPAFLKNTTLVNYQKVREFKQKYLKKAYEKFCILDKTKEYEEFVKQEWVYQYAVFLSLKKQNNLICWNEWTKEQQLWIKDHKYDISHLSEQIGFEMFVQFEFYRQWIQLKNYANRKGIQIMGDIPIYVGIDSLDVWANQECFLLGADSKPTFVAGVPPDYFSATGQRWGNPIYNWEYLKEHQFTFWIQRLQYNAKLFDIIRIDHFRAFDTYWKIPASCETAVEGEWCEAPGYDLFEEVFRLMPDINIVVEDLGDLRPEVYELRDHFGFKGMRIVQFNFIPDEEENSNYDHVENLILYTGSHDNQTIRGWYESQPKKIRQSVREKLKEYGCLTKPAARGLVQFTFMQNCYMAIIPLQDILELGDEARINRPGTLGSPNWEWRLTSLAPFERAIRKNIKYYQF